jgi:hypothetical protein
MDAREAVEETINRLFAAWNSNDACAFIALFTREACYTGTDGVVRQGRVHIEAMVRELVPVVRVAIEGSISVEVQGYRGEATFHWVSAGEGKGRRGIIDCVLIRAPDGWYIDALRNVGSTSV